MSRLKTVHGSSAFVSRSDRHIYHSAARKPANATLLLVERDDCPYAMLTNMDARLKLADLPEASLQIVIPVAGEGRTLSLLLPGSRRYLTAVPVSGEETSGFVFDRLAVGGWETFARIADRRQEPHLDAVAAGLAWLGERLRKGHLDAADLVDLVQATSIPVRQGMLTALLPLLRLSELDAFGRRLVEEPALIAQIAEALPGDRWAMTVLPGLADWLRDRDAPRPACREINEDLDFLVKTVRQQYLSFAHAASTHARRQVVPRKRLCVVATARNEGAYILEWVAHYRALGFEQIFFYTNDNADGSDGLLDALAAHGYLVKIANRTGVQVSGQRKAYGHAFAMLPEILDYDWALTVDLDEFLAFDTQRFATFGDLVEWHERQQADVIAFNWAFVSSTGQTRWSAAPLTRRCTRRIGAVDRHIKSMSRVRNATGSQPHFPFTAERAALTFREANGEMHTSSNTDIPAAIAPAHSDRPDDSTAVLFHYFTKSAEEFLWKFSRNRGSQEKSRQDVFLGLPEQFLSDFLLQFEADGPDISGMLRQSVPDLEARMAEMLEKPDIRAAHEAMIAARDARLARVVAAYRKHLPVAFGENGRQFVALLDRAQAPDVA
ncbi:glycosyltransferase family 2 protein [Ciceribacter sp. sgz301302]